MKIRKTPSNKVSMKLEYDYYVTFCKWVRAIKSAHSHGGINNLDVVIKFLVINRLLNRLSRSVHYPFKSDIQKAIEVNITLEMEEALIIYQSLPGLSSDPLVGFINREIHKIIIN